MKKSIAVVMALVVLLMGLLPLWATAEEMSTDDWWESLVPDVDLPEDISENPAPSEEEPPQYDVSDPVPGQDDSHPDDAGFLDGDIRRVTSQPYGAKTEYAKIGGWTVSRGYLEDRYCLIGQKEGKSQRVALSANDPVSFVPAGDSIIYYAEYAKGKFDWVIHNPDDGSPTRLALDGEDDVFFADGQSIWYITEKAGETRICRMRRSDDEKETVGSTSGNVFTMLRDGAVLVYDFDEETVQLFRDGSFTTVYQGAFQAITTTGQDIWLERDGEYGRLVGGELESMLPGLIMGGAGTSDQQVLLVAPYLDADTLDVVMLSETYQAYAYVGTVRASNNTNIEIAAASITVWGPEESLIFDIPEVSYWYPYGQTQEPKASDDGPAEPAKDGPMDPGTQQSSSGEREAFFSTGGFNVYIPMRQEAADQHIALGGVELEYDLWYAQDDSEVLMIDLDISPLLDEGMRREIEKTGTLRHAQLLVADEAIMKEVGVTLDDGLAEMVTAYVQGIPALVYSEPSDGGGSDYAMVLCQGQNLILFAWSSKAETSLRDAIAFELDGAEMIMGNFGGWAYSIFKRELTLDASGVGDLAALRDFARLTTLSLRDNAVSDLAPLSDLYYLERLDLRGNQISDLSPLYGLTQLKEVRLEGNPELTQADIDQLRKALPNTEISGQAEGKLSSADEPSAEPCAVTMHDLTVTFPGQAKENQFIQDGEGLSPGDSIHEYELRLPEGGAYYFVEFRVKTWRHPAASLAEAEGAFDALLADLGIWPATRVDGGKVHEFPMDSGHMYYWTEYVDGGERCRMVYDSETFYWLIAPNDAQGEAFLNSMTLK